MGIFKTKAVEESNAVCYSEDDLRVALRSLEEVEIEATIEFFVEIELPGLGKQHIELFGNSGVPLRISCIVED